MAELAIDVSIASAGCSFRRRPRRIRSSIYPSVRPSIYLSIVVVLQLDRARRVANAAAELLGSRFLAGGRQPCRIVLRDHAAGEGSPAALPAELVVVVTPAFFDIAQTRASVPDPPLPAFLVEFLPLELRDFLARRVFVRFQPDRFRHAVIAAPAVGKGRRCRDGWWCVRRGRDGGLRRTRVFGGGRTVFRRGEVTVMMTVVGEPPLGTGRSGGRRLGSRWPWRGRALFFGRRQVSAFAVHLRLPEAVRVFFFRFRRGFIKPEWFLRQSDEFQEIDRLCGRRSRCCCYHGSGSEDGVDRKAEFHAAGYVR